MMVSVFVADLAEFAPVVDAARKAGYTVQPARKGYWRIDNDNEIRFERKPMGLRVALWNSALAGGVLGKLATYDREVISIVNS